MTPFNGLGMHLGNLWRLSDARSRSLSAENVTGEKGRGGMATAGTGAAFARDLGQGWKISPSIRIDAGQTQEIGNIDGPGAIQQISEAPAADTGLPVHTAATNGKRQRSQR